MAFILPTYFIFYATASLRHVISFKNTDIEIGKENLVTCLILQITKPNTRETRKNPHQSSLA